MTDAPSLRERLHALETQLRDQTARRDQAIQTANDAQAAILQLQGAIAVVTDLLTPRATGSPNDEEEVAS